VSTHTTVSKSANISRIAEVNWTEFGKGLFSRHFLGISLEFAVN
jgi:hypothetical protein